MNEPLIPDQQKLGQISMKYMVMRFLSERIFSMLFVITQMMLWIKVFELEVKSWFFFFAWYVLFDLMGIFRQWWMFKIELAHQHECQPYAPNIEDFRSDR